MNAWFTNTHEFDIMWFYKPSGNSTRNDK